MEATSTTNSWQQAVVTLSATTEAVERAACRDTAVQNSEYVVSGCREPTTTSTERDPIALPANPC